LNRRRASVSALLIVFLAAAAVSAPYFMLNSKYTEDRIKLLENCLNTDIPEAEGRLVKEMLEERSFSVMDSKAGMLALLYYGNTSTAGEAFKDYLALSERESQRMKIEQEILDLSYSLYERSHFEYRFIILSDRNVAFYIPMFRTENYVINIGTDGLDYWQSIVEELR